MSRGRQLKSKVKEAKALAKATVTATEKAKQKMLEGKPLSLSIREHIGKIIDRIDPIEVVATIGVTLILSDTKAWVDHLIATYTGTEFWSGILSKVQPQQYTFPPSKYGMRPQDWLITFSIAYLIVHNFGLIVQTTGKIASDVLGMAKALLPMAAVV
jgi:hypothetical protein